jgi:hypothetical protein
MNQFAKPFTNMQPPVANRLLGLAACGFFAAHALVQWHAGRPENLLWACHVAALCVGLGLLLQFAPLTAAGVLMLCVGIPLWMINLYFGGAFYPTSILTHIGGFAVGVIGLRTIGWRRHDWLWAVGIVGALLVASRACTAPALNVNLAFFAWRNIFPEPPSDEFHVLLLLGLWAVGLWLSQFALSRWTSRQPKLPAC